MAIKNNKRTYKVYQEYGEIVSTSKRTTCSICYTKKSLQVGCSKGHSICDKCTNKYVEKTLLVHKGGFQKEEIECPTDGCKEHLEWKDVREFLTNKTMMKVLTMWRCQVDIKDDNKKAAEAAEEIDPETKKTISSISKKCPRCKVNIEKNGGCDHVSCRCGKSFYYTCLCDFPMHNSECTSYVETPASGGQELLDFSERVRIAAERLRGMIGGISEADIDASRRENQSIVRSAHGARPCIRNHVIRPFDADEQLRAMKRRRLQHLRDTRAGMMSRLERINNEIDGIETEFSTTGSILPLGV